MGAANSGHKWYLDPEYMEDPDRGAIIKQAIARAAKLSASEIGELVDTLLEDQQSEIDYWTLVALEERAVPAMVAALSGPRFLAVQEPIRDYRTAPALKRLWEQLEPFAPESAVPALSKLMDHPEQVIRRKAALAIGSIGKPACCEALREALRSQDDQTREFALLGIRRSIMERRASAELLLSVFDDVARIVDLPSVGGTHAPEVLLQIDRDRAVAFLSDPVRFQVGHQEISSIVPGLAKARVVLPAASVLRLLGDLKKQERLKVTAYGYGLQLLALTGDSSARSRIEEAMASTGRGDSQLGGDYLRGLASDGFLILEGIPDAYQIAIRKWGGPDNSAKAPEPIRDYVTVRVMLDQVCNGGFEQYFFNSYGQDAHYALAGLKAIGAKASEKIVREVIDLFGKKGPSAMREERQRQLEGLDGGKMEHLTDKFLSDPDHLEVLLARYAVVNKEDFRAKAATK